LIRHGETRWNRERRNQGRLDSPLTERGIAQARAIARLLHDLPEAAAAPIVSSPQGRARRTAEIIRDEPAGCNRELRIDERLREVTAGAWDGLTYAEIEAGCPGVFDGDGYYDWCFRAPGGETYEAFAARLGEWLGEQDDAAPVIAVAHGLVSRVLRGLHAGLPRAAALALPVSQDKIFRLCGGMVDPLAVAGGGGLPRTGCRSRS